MAVVVRERPMPALTVPSGCGESLFMIRGFFLLLMFQLVGEVAARGLGLPAPGPVVGLALLVAALAFFRFWRPFDDEALAQSDSAGPRRAFVRALADVRAGRRRGRAISGLLKEQGVALVAALVVSTLITLLATVGAFLLVKRLDRPEEGSVTPFRLWVYLQTTPLFWLTATLAAYLIADALARAAGRHPLVNPVAIAIALVGTLLKLTGADYQTYFNGAQFVHFLLGPATVALGGSALSQSRARPAQPPADGGGARRRRGRRRSSRRWSSPGARRAARRARLARAEIGDGRRRDGGVRDARWRAAADRGARHRDRHSRRDHGDAADECARRSRLRGARFRRGLASHGIGTARAFQVDPVAGVFAGLAMGLNAVVTPAIIPALLPWLVG